MGTRIFAVRNEGAVFEPSPAELAALMDERGVTVWVSLDKAGEAQRDLLMNVLKLHELLVEDALSVAPTPKAEIHDDYLYLILHGVLEKGSNVQMVDVDLFVGADFLITHHRVDLPSLGEVRKEVQRDAELLRRGPAFVAHRLIDAMIDAYVPTMDRLDAEVVAIEEAVVRDPDPKLLERIFAMRHTLQRIHRVGLHQRRILGQLSAGSLPFVPKLAQPFFRDVEDHFVRVVDLNDTYRELVSASSEAYLSMQSHRLNDVMKILTVISTIMLPLTFVTGLYGMNFDAMPLIHWRYGFEGAMGLMLLSALLSFLWMKRRRWI
ncbi:MAG: magnesium/cobalt transporter CorA [Myxococcota bacterium]